MARKTQLIPASSSGDKELAIAVRGSMALACSLLEEHFGVDPRVTKKAEHIELALRLSALILSESREREGSSPNVPSGGPTLRPRDERRRKEVLRQLRVSHGNVSEVARAMGKARNQIVRWMDRFQIDVDQFRGD